MKITRRVKAAGVGVVCAGAAIGGIVAATAVGGHGGSRSGGAHAVANAPPTTTALLFKAADGTALAAGLASASPQQRQSVVVQQLASQLPSQPILPAATTLTIDASTFQADSDISGTVDATTSSGTISARWRLYLVRVDGRWLLADTAALP